IIKTSEACHLIHSIDEKLEAASHKSYLSLLSCEQSLLNLSSCDETGGLFFACTFELIKEKTIMTRYLEHGSYSGYYRSYGEALINNKLECRTLSLKSFNAADVANDRLRKDMIRKKLKKTKGSSRQRGYYSNNLRNNKTSVVNCLKTLLSELEASSEIRTIGCVVLVDKATTKTNDSDNR
uniref:Uncharacterized protein n=2 Tax=Clytia hemisphaerica TaxID=252671 RepID=A0A7M5V1P1_9CNID